MEQMGEARQNRPCHDSDALVGVGVLHNAIMLDNFWTMEDVVRNLWKEGRLNEDVSDPVSWRKPSPGANCV